MSKGLVEFVRVLKFRGNVVRFESLVGRYEFLGVKGVFIGFRRYGMERKCGYVWSLLFSFSLVLFTELNELLIFLVLEESFWERVRG